MSPRALQSFLSAHASIIRVELTRVRGSSPRNEGAEMFVAQGGLLGTIGGGQLEYLAIERARRMLRDGDLNARMDVPLGPEIGQCCGGRVELSLARLRPRDLRAALSRAQAEQQARPSVYVLGAGHVGRALADLLQHLPVNCVLIDTRREELALCRAEVETRLSVIPEHEIATAPPRSAFVVLTHDHGLDFLLTAAALGRKDAAYVGMIGSATKRIKFRNWLRQQGCGQGINGLICPIGASGSRDKRPSVIAAFVVAEVMAELTSETVAGIPIRENEAPAMGEQSDRTGRTA